MSLSNETVRSLSTANGVTTAFAIPHSIISSDSSEVEVYLVDESADPITETLQVEGALQDYTLTGASPPTTPFDTHVTFNTAPTNGLKVLIQRKIALTQPTDLDENGPFPAEEVEVSLDRLAAEIQLLNLKVSRALKTRQSAPTANLNPSLPEPSAGRFLRWNDAEDGFENANPVGGPGSPIDTPASSTDNAIARWNGTTGDELANSGVIIDDSDNITGVASIAVTGNIRNAQLTASRVVVTDGDKDLASSATTETELGYLSGVTSAIQTQLDAKLADANDEVTNANLVNMAESTLKGRAAGAGTGDPTDLSATQATAILDNFVGDSGSGGTKGLVPAPASGDAAASKFLKADGTWATTAGGGDVAGPASSTDNALARFDSTTGKIIQNSGATLDDSNILTTAGLLLSGLTASRALQTDGSKNLQSSSVTSTELGYLAGVTSAIQTQLNGKLGALTVQTKTSSYTALVTDDVILCSGSSFTVTLPPVSTAYRTLTIKKTDSGSGVFTVDPDSAETVGGNATTALRTIGETVVLVPTSSGWNIVSRITTTNWISYTPTLSTWASNITVTGFWRRIGDSIQVQILIAVTGATSGNLTAFTLPNSWTAASAKMIAPSTGFYWGHLATLRDNGSATYTGFTYPIAGSNFVGLQYLDAAAQGGGISASAPFTWANGDTIAAFVELPITDFEAS